MTQRDIELLRASINKAVRVRCRDGEVFVGKAISVSEEEQDLIYDVITTSRESQYRRSDLHPAYRIMFDEIESVELYEQ
jgi:small nuclear ribonucleoprotein (snRNP)-like protein